MASTPAAAARRMALLLVALAAAPLALGQDACLSNPTDAACVNYTVHEAVLQRDLGKLCTTAALGGAAYSGWPAACTLWHECQQGRAWGAGCHSLSLLQTACNEAITSSAASDVCMTYMTLCAPQSVVAQCTEQQPIHELRSAMQYHASVAKLCPVSNDTVGSGSGSGHGDAAVTAAGVPAAGGGGAGGADLPAACRECTALSFDPNKVTVQALQANCPDPLGTLSMLCLEGNSSAQEQPCASWAQFCTSQAGQDFPGLCGGSGAPAPAPLPASPPPASPPAAERSPKAQSPAPGKAPAAGGGGGAALVSPLLLAPPPGVPPSPPPQKAGVSGTPAGELSCYANPRQDACRTFHHQDADSVADIHQLCASFPTMVGCSLWQQCSSGAATGNYCQPFSVLGTICLPNPGVAGCESWAALCGTSGSVVQQCITAAPIRNVLMTSQTIDAVVKGCSSQGAAAVSGCAQCTSAGTGCPDPLSVLSQLCRESPSTPQCANFAAMCAEAGSTFTTLCSGAVDGDGDEWPAEAKMYLHASMSAMILFHSWVPASDGAYVASCLAIIALAFTVQALKAYAACTEARWAALRARAAAEAAAAARAAARCTDRRTSMASARASIDIGPIGSSDGGKGGQKGARRSSNIMAPMLWRGSLGRLMSSGGTPRHERALGQGQGRQQRQPYVTKQELARNAARSLLTGAAVWLDYMLLLVVVTFNLGLITSATLGCVLGALAFGHWGERAAAEAAAASSGSGSGRPPLPGMGFASSEGDLEVPPYVAPVLLASQAAAPALITQEQTLRQQHATQQQLPTHQPPIVSVQ